MKKSLIALAALSVVAAAFASPRARTHDIAFGYRMGAGFAGDVNRTHPAGIAPYKLNQTNPPLFYGDPVIFNTADNTVKGIRAAQASDVTPMPIAGIVARPWPVQSATSAGSFGQQLLTDSTGVVATVVNDVLTEGYAMAKVRGASPGNLTIDSAVYVFCAVDEAGHVQGGFETTAIAGKTVLVSNAKFRGPADANGIAEIQIFPAVS